MRTKVKRRRTGKIARLPKLLRDEVNHLILDGVTYPAIIERLARDGIVVKQDNLIAWKSGGHEDWLEEQRRLEDMRAIREFCLQVLNQHPDSTIQQAGQVIAASQLYQLLNDFQPSTLKAKLKTDPAHYARILNALVRLGDGGLKLDRYKAEVARQKDKIQQQLDAAKPGGLTDEAIAEIEKALNLL